jgi:hypothetical protein
MNLDFSINTTTQNTFGTFIFGQFLETPPLFATDQMLKMGPYTFEIWGRPKGNVWTLKLITEGVFNEVLEEQTVKLEVL